MSGGNINAAKCADYLRSVGVEIGDEVSAAWLAQERDHRARRRAHNRELKKSCGHFRTHWTATYHEEGRTDVQSCSDCYAVLEYRGASITARQP